MKPVSDIGLIGLAVMGENLVLNMESKGFHVSVFNRTVEKVDKFMEGRGKGKNIYGARSLEDFVSSLKSPRKVFLMVKAGQAVDDFIDKLIPLLDKGDIIIDGGNTHFPDTTRRTAYVESKGLLYVGTGVSGGEEGALNGPSMMPGGSPAAWPYVKPIFQGICAKVADGTPCCDWVGEGGAGHFVKMVHNGIEYGDIQLICECYQIMKDILGMTNEEMHEVFAEWNKGDLDSYLIEITRDILAKKDEDGKYVLDYILDTAGQKGTGKWTAVAALDAGVPLTLIGEAVFARCLSAQKHPRFSRDLHLSSSQVTGRPSSRISARPSSLPRWCLMRRVTLSCAQPQRNTDGISTTAESPSCGGAAASSAASSSARSRRLSTRILTSPTSFSTLISATSSPRLSRVGGMCSDRLS